MTVYRKFLLMGCVKVVLAIIGNCYAGLGETSVSERGCFATIITISKILLFIINFCEKKVKRRSRSSFFFL
jgi:hypothetical protein